MFLLRLPAVATSAAVARHTLAAMGPGFLEPQVADDAQLLVSELVTNCLKHAGLAETETVEVCLRTSPQMVMVEVADHGCGLGGMRPRPSVPLVDPTSPVTVAGWGLLLVELIAYRWGIVEDNGTRVWFELRRTDAASTVSTVRTSRDLLLGHREREREVTA